MTLRGHSTSPGALLHAAMIVSLVIDSDPSRPRIDQALQGLGLERIQLLPVRVK
ncbi:hypothetical protein ACWEWI_30955 [Streptomyces sp. NPDC003753]